MVLLHAEAKVVRVQMIVGDSFHGELTPPPPPGVDLCQGAQFGCLGRCGGSWRPLLRVHDRRIASDIVGGPHDMENYSDLHVRYS